MGLNHMSDWHQEELDSFFNLNTELPPDAEFDKYEGVRSNGPIDWRDHEGIVNDIKDQG